MKRGNIRGDFGKYPLTPRPVAGSVLRMDTNEATTFPSDLVPARVIPAGTPDLLDEWAAHNALMEREWADLAADYAEQEMLLFLGL